ncbi:dihydroneopterin aldolase [Pseudogracilibacillus auburnensis]|uniref:dihydroneopterin aldolase n=1 Tax=Pseudogracilibacillus auburnensis TaxID=1494959 RepID=UPI001A960998|nr:dihydroneopterin aldolase [Pseudogracilibacillus auburnensis]MBO1004700.1 dihydroneopterin aldolase [Pseudogracilibacillus auburnensis]
MDKIFLNEMEFYGYHGALPEETRLGQRFRVTVILETDLQAAGKSDDLDLTVNYAEVYQLCKEVVENQTYKLIEAVAEKIAEATLSQFSTVKRVSVKVIKPDPPIPGHYQSVAVEITREQS